MKKTFWRILLYVSLIACICCLGFAVWYLYQDQQAQKAYEQAQEAVEEPKDEKEEEKPTLEEIENAEFTGERDGEAAECPDDVFLDMENPIDFGVLQEINPDLYAWIRIPDTNIDYPIAQRAGDDAYYLSHDMYQEPRFAGCIYTEDCNSKDFHDPNTVIYGHNMKNTTMFQNLYCFAESSFFDEHPYFYIYMPDRILAYKVFAAYSYDDRHIMNSFDFDDKKVFKQYLEEVFSLNAMYLNRRDDMEVTVNDKIVTLATCMGGSPNERYLVQAVLIKEEKNE